MKILRFEKEGRKHLVLVLEKENLERILSGDPFDLDTETFYASGPITFTVGFMEEAAVDPAEVMHHILRNVHRTADDGKPPQLIGSGHFGR